MRWPSLEPFFSNCDSQDKLRWRSLTPASTWQGRNVTKERGRNVPVMRDGPQQLLKRSVMRCLSIYELCKGSRRQFRPSTLIQKKIKSPVAEMYSRQQHKRWHLKGSTLVKCTGYINSVWLKALLAFTVWAWMYNNETVRRRERVERGGDGQKEQRWGGGGDRRGSLSCLSWVWKASLSCEHCHILSVLIPLAPPTRLW